VSLNSFAAEPSIAVFCGRVEHGFCSKHTQTDTDALNMLYALKLSLALEIMLCAPKAPSAAATTPAAVPTATKPAAASAAAA